MAGSATEFGTVPKHLISRVVQFTTPPLDLPCTTASRISPKVRSLVPFTHPSDHSPVAPFSLPLLAMFASSSSSSATETPDTATTPDPSDNNSTAGRGPNTTSSFLLPTHPSSISSSLQQSRCSFRPSIRASLASILTTSTTSSSSESSSSSAASQIVSPTSPTSATWNPARASTQSDRSEEAWNVETPTVASFLEVSTDEHEEDQDVAVDHDTHSIWQGVSLALTRSCQVAGCVGDSSLRSTGHAETHANTVRLTPRSESRSR